MNKKQKRILLAVIAIMIAMLVYPPFHVVGNNGVVSNMGYRWVFDPPKTAYIVATVNISMLLIQWIGIWVVGGLAFFLTKSTLNPNIQLSATSSTTAVTSVSYSSDAKQQLDGVKGWLLFLCVSLTILSPLFTLSQLVIEWQGTKPYFEALPSLKNAVILEMLCMVGLMAFSIYSGSALWSVKPNAVKLAKNYFLVILVYSLAFPFIFFSIADLPSEANNEIIKEGIKNAFRGIVAFAIWFTYSLPNSHPYMRMNQISILLPNFS